MAHQPTLFDGWERHWEPVNRLAARLEAADTHQKIVDIIRTIHGDPRLESVVKSWWKEDTGEFEEGQVRPMMRLSQYLKDHAIRVAELLRELPYLETPSALSAMRAVDRRAQAARTLAVETADRPHIVFGKNTPSTL